ncbi:MAG: ATP-dependent DNA helicase RecG [Phenylobacterium sp.]|jgi:ATP-dependent DNA helicase RecG
MTKATMKAITKSTSLASIPTSVLKGVGPRLVERLAKLNVHSLQDLLFHLPSRYEDRTRIYPIITLLPSTHVSVQGEIEETNVVLGRRRMMLCTINDGSGRLTLRFFNFSAAQKNSLARGRTIKCFGEIRRGNNGYEIVHPEYKLIDDQVQTIAVAETLTPVYPSTEGVKQLTLRTLTDQALNYLNQGMLTELFPDGLYPNQISLKEAIAFVHRPPPDAQTSLIEEGKHPAQQRLIIEELLAHNLSMLKLRQNSNHHDAVTVDVDNSLEQRFLASLPFSPTGAQSRVMAEIRQDLTRPIPMMRLVQGDVGSGKTLVAALAALTAISSGFQVALMAPTELLAEQHANNFNQWFEPLDIKVAWLAGKTKGKARKAAIEVIKNGEAQMIVGTHALFQESVEFHKLAMIIIDEQHRFGVHQRLTLREKGVFDGFYPHQLVMTATPIPRTLAMTAYADLDVSVIDELPPGRTPITTVAMPDTRREDIVSRVRESCLNGKRQAYWVCTLIEESEVLECQAAEDTAEELKAILPELAIGLVHGRMKSAQKQAIMAEFKAGNLHLLVATTVIEVGVDVPNASLMVIENPERLGLAQLHQLRGRVGRGSVASHCVLLYHAPLSKTAKKRLGVLRQSNDGFVIAQKDLEIRGPGEVLGTKQTGLADLKIADLVRDASLIPQVQQLAHHMWTHYPEHCERIIERWIGDKEIYSQA